MTHYASSFLEGFKSTSLADAAVLGVGFGMNCAFVGMNPVTAVALGALSTFPGNGCGTLLREVAPCLNKKDSEILGWIAGAVLVAGVATACGVLISPSLAASFPLLLAAEGELVDDIFEGRVSKKQILQTLIVTQAHLFKISILAACVFSHYASRILSRENCGWKHAAAFPTIGYAFSASTIFAIGPFAACGLTALSVVEYAIANRCFRSP